MWIRQRWSMDALCENGFSVLNAEHSDSEPFPKVGTWVRWCRGGEVGGKSGRRYLWLFQNPKLPRSYRIWVGRYHGGASAAWGHWNIDGVFEMADLSGVSRAWLNSSVLFFLLSHSPGPGPGLPFTRHPDTPCSICSPSTWVPLAFLAGLPRNNRVSMATWRQLKNGS